MLTDDNDSEMGGRMKILDIDMDYFMNCDIHIGSDDSTRSPYGGKDDKHCKQVVG